MLIAISNHFKARSICTNEPVASYRHLTVSFVVRDAATTQPAMCCCCHIVSAINRSGSQGLLARAQFRNPVNLTSYARHRFGSRRLRVFSSRCDGSIQRESHLHCLAS